MASAFLSTMEAKMRNEAWGGRGVDTINPFHSGVLNVPSGHWMGRTLQQNVKENLKKKSEWTQ